MYQPKGCLSKLWTKLKYIHCDIYFWSGNGREKNYDYMRNFDQTLLQLLRSTSNREIQKLVSRYLKSSEIYDLSYWYNEWKFFNGLVKFKVTYRRQWFRIEGRERLQTCRRKRNERPHGTLLWELFVPIYFANFALYNQVAGYCSKIIGGARVNRFSWSK